MREGRSDGHHEEAVVPIQETEQKRNTLEQVRDAFSTAAQNLKEGRRFGDAEVVERALAGLKEYRERVATIGGNVRRIAHRNPKPEDLASKTVLAHGEETFLPEDEFYRPPGFLTQKMRRRRPQRAPDYDQGFVAIRELGKEHPDTGHGLFGKKLVQKAAKKSRAMTHDGKAQLLRLLGVLGVDEQLDDLPARANRERQERDPKARPQLPPHYYMTLDSLVLPEGVKVGIFSDTQMGPERSEWRLDILLPEAAINELLAEKQ